MWSTNNHSVLSKQASDGRQTPLVEISHAVALFGDVTMFCPLGGTTFVAPPSLPLLWTQGINLRMVTSVATLAHSLGNYITLIVILNSIVLDFVLYIK